MEEHGALLAGGTIIFTIVIIVISFAAAIIPMILIFRWLGKMKANNDQLLMTGMPGQGRIVQMSPTGMTINDAPQLNITVEVHPQVTPGYRGAAAPFMATLQALVPIYAMPRIQPGQTVPVRFDPMNPMRIAIDFRSMGYG
jgi:hypothetical protein